MSPVSFTLPTPPSTNALFKNVTGKGRVRTEEYNNFLAFGLVEIRRQRVRQVKGYVVQVIGVERMSGRADIDNRLKALLDVMVKAGVIEDDRFVTAIAVSWLPFARGETHISITPVQHMSLDFHPSQNGTCGGFYKISTIV